MNTFSQQLKRYRILANLTQEDLASEINMIYNYPISKSTISQLENGRIEPNIDLLICFANYFNVSINRLLGLNPKNNSYEVQFRTEELKLQIISFLIEKFDNINPSSIYSLDRIIKDFFDDIE